MSGRTRQGATPARLRLAAGLIAAAGLAGCQSANQAMGNANQAMGTAVTEAYEQTSLTGNIDHLAPWVAPDKSMGTVFQFLPFSGVPVNTADAIYKTIRGHASEEGIVLALRLDEPSTFRVRTLINAVGTADASTFIFIVEIYDVAGKRVHRFVGQEYGVAPSGEPWSGIDSDTERHLGDRILAGVKAWVTRVR